MSVVQTVGSGRSITTLPAVMKLALPKGRMQEGIFTLLADAGVHVRVGARGYRPSVSLEGVDAKLIEVLDTKLDAVRLVAAAPESLLINGKLPDRPLVIASEYERITRGWISEKARGAKFVKSYGATEVFPPEDADCIVDVASTGDTLRAQNLCVFDEIMTSSTRLYASPQAWNDPARRAAIDRLAMLLRSVLEARERVMLEVNVSQMDLERVVGVLPCMREPTISPLHGQAGFAVKAAVPKRILPTLIPEIKAKGGTDIVVTQLSQIIP